MPSRDADTRAVTLVDLPVVTRLIDRGVVLDSDIEFTRDARGLNGAVFSAVLLPQRGVQTLVTRSGKQTLVGQMRVRGDDHVAQIIYITPDLDADVDDTAWLHILDAMAREAGRHGAHVLVAEVDEDSTLFETMRTAGFAVYARQQIWRRQPGPYPAVDLKIDLEDVHDADTQAIYSLMANTVPRLIQQVAQPPPDAGGWVYRKDGRIEAYLMATEGRHGVYIVPYIHPDCSLELAGIFDAALQRVAHHHHKTPVYVCVRRHIGWIASTLEYLDFEPGPRQAVMVRHITAGIRQAHFSPVRQPTQAVPVNKPPTKPLHQCAAFERDAG